MKKIILLTIVSSVLAGCSLVPSAWKSVRSGAVVEPTPVVTAEPTQTLEQLDQSVTTDLETSLDVDLKQIDEDLKAIDEEAKSY